MQKPSMQVRSYRQKNSRLQCIRGTPQQVSRAAAAEHNSLAESRTNRSAQTLVNLGHTGFIQKHVTLGRGGGGQGVLKHLAWLWTGHTCFTMMRITWMRGMATGNDWYVLSGA